MAKFTHLHVHSEYSLLDGLSRLNELFAKALELGMNSLALTDHGVLYGAHKFYLASQEYEIKPIIGCEAYMAAGSRFDKKTNLENDRHHLILLAKNQNGWQNLMKLISLAHLEGFYYRPRIDMAILTQYCQDLIATTACLEGEIPSLLRRGEEKKARAKAQEMQKLFGENFYLEIQHHPKIKDQAMVNEKVVKLSRQLGIPLVATNDVHYVEADDAEAQDALLAVQTQKMMADKDRMTMIDSPDFYLKSQEEMIKDFKDYPDAIKNTQKIAQQCNLEIPTGQWHLPKYEVPQTLTPEKYLQKLASEGLKKRYPKITQIMKDRLNYELKTICDKGYATYFLIVQDFVNWAKKQGIRVGPGRGSVAGSLVSYSLRITSIDPLYFQLPFERFMHPERPSTPDIDLDFADNRRDEVIDYVVKKYGQEQVAHIISFGRMESKGAVRDIGRVLGMPYADPDKIAKLIPMGDSIDEALENVPELKSYYQQPEFKKLLDLAKRVEGVARHASVHAAGVVIGDKPLTNYVPLQLEPKTKQKRVTQFDMYDIDIDANKKAVGLLKIDFLGLRNLSILEQCLKIVADSQGKKIDLSAIPLDDTKTFKLLSQGATIGVFQLESGGMQKNIKELKPTTIFDLMAMVALYRPGPIQVIPEFIRRKHNPSEIRYLDPRLKDILARSYGLITYQDDVLLIATQIAGYTWGEADELRHAMSSKKHRPDMNKLKGKFVEGCVKNGLPPDKADELFKLVEPFGAYGFNKSHSACYATVAYQTAYMKANFPVEFMAALLTAEASSSSGPTKDEKITAAVKECKMMGIVVLPPDINRSKTDFTLEDWPQSLKGKAIRFGLSAIKNVGQAAIEVILNARDTDGKFKSLTDFCQRVDSQKANKKVLESLIKAGAMDQFGKRAAMLSGLEEIRSKGTRLQKEKSNGQTSLFDDQTDSKSTSSQDNLPNIEEFSHQELLLLEKNLLGFYLTEHPLTATLTKISQYLDYQLNQITREEHQGRLVVVAGMVADLRIVHTRKNNQEMAFAKIEDDTGTLDLVIFPKIFKETKATWTKERVVLIEGKVEYREDSLSVLVDKAAPPEEATKVFGQRQSRPKANEIQIPSHIPSAQLMALNKLFRENPGQDRVVLVFNNSSGQSKRMPLAYGINFNDQLKAKIKQLIDF